MSAPRVRFAPSPTGSLHVGGARTALFNWLFARQTGGTFVLRIEDTDKERSTEAHTQVILDGLAWLGIDFDEGPYFQGACGDRHRADVDKLLEDGKAYRDFMTAEDLAAERKRAEDAGRPFRYDRDRYRVSDTEAARRAERGEPFAIRFQVPDEEIAWHDAVHGRISFQGADVDDFVVVRSDGSAIYNMAVVSDDIAMAITHVIRGDDHVSNTPKQIALYRALGRTPPIFAHVPMILGTDGKKLSKRHGATAVGEYQHLGIFPQAMRNFLALLGWSPGEDIEILPEADMIRRFSLEAIQSKPAVFDPQKLEWMNGQYLSATPAQAFLDEIVRLLAAQGIAAESSKLLKVITAAKTRSRTLLHLTEQVAVRLDARRIVVDAKAEALRTKLGDRYVAALRTAADLLAPVASGDWNAERLLVILTDGAATHEYKLGDLLQPIRAALTGSTVSEPVNELLDVVGQTESLARLRAAAA